MAGTAKPVLAVAADTPGAAAELQAALARRFGADDQVVASASAAALGRGTGPAQPATGLTARADGGQVLSLADGSQAACRAVALTTGVSYRRLPVPG